MKVDARVLVSFGVAGLGLVALWRTQFASNAGYWSIALPFLAQGVAMPFFFVPTTQIALAAVRPEETASAAGLSNFLRTISAAFGTAIVTTMWGDAAARNHADMAGALNDPAAVQRTLEASGLTPAQALAQIDSMTQGQAVMLATNQIFVVVTAVFAVAALVVWLSPKPNIQLGAREAGGH
jgi:DHA2 family multidrug resistance protein